MSERAEITTIIRTFNRCSKTLDAIQSVVVQTLSGQPIIVVDDGSTDGVIESVQKMYGTRVTVFRHDENKGVGAAANTGMQAVSTPFVAFLDSDDEWEPDFLKTMLASLDAAPGATLAYSDIRLEFPEHALDYAIRMKDPDVISNQMHLPPFTMSSVLCRTSSVRKAGVFSETLEIGEDSDFYLRMWLRVPESFVHVKSALVRHRIWSGNITNDLNSLIRELDFVTRRYLRHPYFHELKDSYAEVSRQRLLGVAARHQIGKWLAAKSKRSISLIVTSIKDIDGLIVSLKSALNQRLPPIDVAVISDSEQSMLPPLREVANADWPFVINVVPIREGSCIGESIQYAINVLTGNAVVFLKAGEELISGALDYHRHAFSSSPQSVVMSFGATMDVMPNKLPNNRKDIAASLIDRDGPISLSTVSISRKALLGLNVLPKHRDKGFFLSLMLSLLVNTGPLVRISKPVVYRSGREVIDQEVLIEVLRDLSEFDSCHELIGVFDQALDRRKEELSI